MAVGRFLEMKGGGAALVWGAHEHGAVVVCVTVGNQ